jgi:hypothetical protein
MVQSARGVGFVTCDVVIGIVVAIQGMRLNA